MLEVGALPVHGIYGPPRIFDTAKMEMRILRHGAESWPAAAVVPLTSWFSETFVVRDKDSSGIDVLLSGMAMRQHLYFATAPGNRNLYVAVSKHGIASELPPI